MKWIRFVLAPVQTNERDHIGRVTFDTGRTTFRYCKGHDRAFGAGFSPIIGGDEAAVAKTSRGHQSAVTRWTMSTEYFLLVAKGEEKSRRRSAGGIIICNVPVPRNTQERLVGVRLAHSASPFFKITTQPNWRAAPAALGEAYAATFHLTRACLVSHLQCRLSNPNQRRRPDWIR
jgi:hypothetical protein